ncbi:PREDICTED: uncharacterized protein LOC106917032 [Poecilia mexicana]|uniref:uncharacterized protein LOC103134954 n=1 Tax=Poecilia formosa TaxID=48698 RepID=UPI0004443DF1|nr:PREDICTED: uncharacterized protein LOC103134954 [Poecilia formosa]XP_014841177.1 PREDICTED: uncharacterized protein LOC106917032 [Poecilia mexicana]
MKDGAGLLGVACACMVLLVEGLVARNAATKRTAGESCKLKDMANLTRHQMRGTLLNFDKANGEHLGTWSPGFPELEVHLNSPLNASKVLCSLTFMAEGLEKILEDQKDDLNPTNISLHNMLRETIEQVKMLKGCVALSFKAECPKKILPPQKPEYGFERKQWSHTLLMSAEKYLGWLQHIIPDRKARQISKKTLHASSTGSKYLEGSVHYL